MGSSPTGHPAKKSAVALQRRIFLFGGVSSGLEQGGGAKRRNQSPSGAFKRQSGLRKQMEGLCPDKLCGALQTHFHRKGRNGKQTAYPQRDCF